MQHGRRPVRSLLSCRVSLLILLRQDLLLFMCRINPFYALAYILALIAGIPYWRFLGLIG